MKPLICMGVALFCLTHTVTAYVADPAWWNSSQTILVQSPPETRQNYSPANLGQLKALAHAARDHLEATLPGGAGTAIDNLIQSWASSTADNRAPVNIGQLKAVAELFYDRLAEEGFDPKANLIRRGYPESWAYNTPWNPSAILPPAENYTIANIGQLKLCFSFECYKYSNTVYVNPASPGAQNGESSTTAFHTVQEALTAANHGDRILLAPGIYRESLEMSKSGTVDEPITIEGNGKAIICGSEPISGWLLYDDSTPRTDSNGVPFRIFKANWNHLLPYSQGVTHLEGSTAFQHDSWTRYEDTIFAGGSLENPRGRILRSVTSLAELKTTPWSVFADRRVTLASNPLVYINLPNDSTNNNNWVPEGFSEPGTAALHIEGAVSNPLLVPGSSQYVELRNLRFLNSSNTVQTGMVKLGTNWKAFYCTFEGSAADGVQILGDNVLMKGCTLTRNGIASLSASTRKNIILEGCDFSFNNWKVLCIRFEGSFKIFGGTTGSNDIHILNCRSFYNVGPGFWFDSKVSDFEVTGCEVFGNSSCEDTQAEHAAQPAVPINSFGGAGVMIEICEGPAFIHRNTIFNNETFGVWICESSNSDNGTARSAGAYATFPPPTLNGPLEIWENTFSRNRSALAFRDGGRERHDARTDDGKPYATGNVVFGPGEHPNRIGNTIYPQEESVLISGMGRLLTSAEAAAEAAFFVDYPVPDSNHNNDYYTQWRPDSAISVNGNIYGTLVAGQNASLASQFLLSNWPFAIGYYPKASVTAYEIETTSFTTAKPFEKRSARGYAAYLQADPLPTPTPGLYDYGHESPSRLLPKGVIDGATTIFADKRYTQILGSVAANASIEIPIYRRGEITVSGGNVSCPVYDIYGYPLTLRCSDQPNLQLLKDLPTVSLVRPLYLKVLKSPTPDEATIPSS